MPRRWHHRRRHPRPGAPVKDSRCIYRDEQAFRGPCEGRQVTRAYLARSFGTEYLTHGIICQKHFELFIAPHMKAIVG